MAEDKVRKSEGHIVTFYSFKGGTGRTMALANIAWILASNGKRVLAVDWDLESPGLHAYFQPFLDDKRLAQSRGVIDLIQDFAQAMVEADEHTDLREMCTRYANVERQAVSLRWRFPDGGVLDLLPAGQQDETYSTRVNMFDWASFYERLNGDFFLDALRADMRRRYHYILIDSRTGLSDTAGTCTIAMPDTVVQCFTLNAQSINGAAAVARSIAQQRRHDGIRILPVPMKVENAEQAKLETGRDHARRQLSRFLDMTVEQEQAHWGELEIPYKPFFAYEEILAVFGERPRQQGSLLSAYERLTKAITCGEVTSYAALDEPQRRLWLSEFEWRQVAFCVPVLISYSPTDWVWAEWVANVLRAFGHSVTLEEVGHTPDEQELLAGPPAAPDRRTVVIGSSAFARSPDAERFWHLQAQRDPDGSNLVLFRIDDSAMPWVPPSARQVDAGTGVKDTIGQALLAAFGHPPALFRVT